MVDHPDNNKGFRKPMTLLASGLIALALLTGCTPAAPPTTEPTTIPTTEAEAMTPEGVKVNGVDLGGMTLEEVKFTLSTISNLYETTDMTVVIEEAQYTLPAADGIARLDVEKVASLILKARPGEFNLAPYIIVDQSTIAEAVTQWESVHTVPSVPTSWTVTGEMPTLEPTAEEPLCQVLTLVKGTTGKVLDGDGLKNAIVDAYQTQTFSVIGTVTPEEPEVFDINTVHSQYYIAPVDAVMDMKTFEVSQEVYGYTFDAVAAQEAWDTAEEGTEFGITFTRVAPATTKESLSSLLFRDVLGSCNTSHTNNYNRNNNLRLACKAMNGKVLMPGETFSFNGTLGERTTAKGYLAAGAYAGGQVVSEVGGGICQVSSTLYNAALLADLQIVTRYNHGMTVSYVKLGLDATVNWGTTDFRFKNNTNYPIRIEASVSNGYVRIKIIGTDERDYYVKMTYDINETIPFDVIYQEMYANNPEGYKDGDVIISPFTGYKVTSYRCKYDKETGKLISKEKEASSSYRKVDKVICKIVPDPNAPTQPPETQPPETQPPETQPPVHEHQYSSVVTAPTCTDGGFTTHTCSCGHSYKDSETAALGHSYTDRVVAPTESEQGYTEHTCSRCGHSYKDSFTDPLPTQPPETQPPETEPPETQPDPTETEPLETQPDPTETSEPAA